VLTQALTQASALALMAAALLAWPPTVAALRLKRTIADVTASEGLGSERLTAADGALPGWARSRWMGRSLAGAAVAALVQIWSWPVALVVIAVGWTAGRGLLRARSERAAARADQAAVEGLGVLVAELRAGRCAGDALTAAGRHCGHPLVGDVLSRLGRSVRLGDRLASGFDRGPAPPTRYEPRPSAVSAPATAEFPRGAGDPVRGGSSEWQLRLVDGLRLSHDSGCALADVVAAVESDLADRGHRRADLRAAAAGHRATVALLAGLPVLGLAMGSGIGAEPVQTLTTTWVGNVLLLSGVGLELIGLTWSRRITDAAMRDR